jgi:hypothetical protein
VTIDVVWVGEQIYCSYIYTQHSEPQAITAPSLISTLYKSPQHLLSLFQPAVLKPAVPRQRLLTVEILQVHALRSSIQPPLQNSLNTAPCRAQLNCTQPAWGSSPYSLGVDPTENTASITCSTVVMGGCLATAKILLTCLPAVTKQRMFLFAIVA